MVHELGAVDSDGRHLTVWRRVYRTVLCVLGHLAESVLLLVWFPVSRVLHPGGELWADRHCDDVLSAVWRGLSVVVAEFYCVWRIGGVHFILRGVLLLHQARDYRVHSDTVVHWLYGDYGADVLAVDRYNWILCRVLFHTKDLQCSED